MQELQKLRTKRFLWIFFGSQLIGLVLFGYYGQILFSVIGVLVGYVYITYILINKEQRQALKKEKKFPGQSWIISIAVFLFINSFLTKLYYGHDYYLVNQWIESFSFLTDFISKLVPSLDYYTNLYNSNNDNIKALYIRHMLGFSWFVVFITLPFALYRLPSEIKYLQETIKSYKKIDITKVSKKQQYSFYFIFIFIFLAVLWSLCNYYIGSNPRNSYNNFDRYIWSGVVISAYGIYLVILFIAYRVAKYRNILRG